MTKFLGSISAHARGYTCLSLNETGEQIITGGQDGQVKIWQSITDSEPLKFSIAKKINSILCKRESFVVASESTTVQFYRLMDGASEPGGVALRFTTDVTHLVFNKYRNKLAAASNDFTAKVVDIRDPDETPVGLHQEQNPLYFSTSKVLEHDGSVLSVALDPKDDWLATTCCDGWLRLWSLNNEDEESSSSPNMLKLHQIFHKSVADSSCLPCLYRMAWKPNDGDILAVCSDSQIILFNRNNEWAPDKFIPKLVNLTDDGPKASFTDCIFSADGNYLVGGTTDGWIMAWDLKTQHCVKRYRNPNGGSICAMCWSIQDPWNLFFTDIKGSLSAVYLPLANLSESTLPQIPESDEFTEDEILAMQGLFDEDGEESKKAESVVGFDDDLEMSAAFDQIMDAEAAKNPPSSKEDLSAPLSPYAASDTLDRAFVGDASAHVDLDDDDDEDETVIDISKIKAAYMGSSDEEETKEGAAKVDVINDILDKVNAANTAPQTETVRFVQEKTTPSQPAFQPGSTPFLMQSERFLLWNRIATIREFSGQQDGAEDGVGSFEIDFHDATHHHSIRVVNDREYEMADITPTALLLASQGPIDKDDEESDLRAHVYYRTWTPKEEIEGTHVVSTDKEGQFSLQSGESILSIGICGGKPLASNEDDEDVEIDYQPGNLLAVVACAVRHQNTDSVYDESSSDTSMSVWLRVFSLSASGLPICAPILVASSSPKTDGIVTICGSRCHLLLVRNAPGLPRPKLQNLEWCVISLERLLLEGSFGDIHMNHDEELFQWRRLPLGTNATLAWIGFSEEGTPYLSDSHGMLYGYLNGAWRAIINMRTELKNASDHFFVVSVHERPEQVGVVYCKGSRYPRPLPRPIMRLLPFKIPVMISSGELANLEEEYIRQKLMLQHLQKPWDDTIKVDYRDRLNKLKAAMLKLFALAVVSEDESRALEIAHHMPDGATLQLAIRYAARMNKRSMTEKLTVIARQKVYRQGIPEKITYVPRSSKMQGKRTSSVLSSEESSEEESNDTDERRSRASVTSSMTNKKMTHVPYKKAKLSNTSAKQKYVESDDEEENQPTTTTSSSRPRSHLVDVDSMSDEEESSSRDNPSNRQNNTSPIQTSPRRKSAVFSVSPLSTLNPFRVESRDSPSISKIATSNQQARKSGGWVFDDMPKNPKVEEPAEKPLSSGPIKTIKQATLFGAPAPTKSKSSDNVTKKRPSQVSKNCKNDGFLEWFESHREMLEEEFPHLSMDELEKEAKLRYNETMQSKTNKQISKAEEDVLAHGGPAKRGRPKASENTVSKLNKFSII